MNPRRSLPTIFTFFLLLGNGTSGSAAMTVFGTINTDTIWTSADTIRVIGDVTVAPTAQLTIEPGALIFFMPATNLFVDGQLAAVGEAGDSILFTSVADTAGGSPSAGSWKGVRFRNGAGGTLRYCLLRYAETCVALERAAPAVDSCFLENFSLNGMFVDGLAASTPITPVIRDCIVRQSAPGPMGTGKGISVYRRADVTISGCEIAGCYIGLDFAPYSTYLPHFVVTDCVIKDNSGYGICTRAG